jgi:hypothetical protein
MSRDHALEDVALDDIHQCALAEFDDEPDAIYRLNLAYAECRLDYIAVLEILRRLLRQ